MMKAEPWASNWKTSLRHALFLPPFPFLNLSSQSTDGMARDSLQTWGPVWSPGDNGRQLEAAPASCLSLLGLVEQLQWNHSSKASCIPCPHLAQAGTERPGPGSEPVSASVISQKLLPWVGLRLSTHTFSPVLLLWSKLYLLSAHNWNPNIFISVDPALAVKPPLLAVSRVAAALEHLCVQAHALFSVIVPSPRTGSLRQLPTWMT